MRPRRRGGRHRPRSARANRRSSSGAQTWSRREGRGICLQRAAALSLERRRRNEAAGRIAIGMNVSRAGRERAGGSREGMAMGRAGPLPGARQLVIFPSARRRALARESYGWASVAAWEGASEWTGHGAGSSADRRGGGQRMVTLAGEGTSREAWST